MDNDSGIWWATDIGELVTGYADPGALCTSLRKPWDDWQAVVKANALDILDIEKGVAKAKAFRVWWQRYKAAEAALKTQRPVLWRDYEACVIGTWRPVKWAEKLGKEDERGIRRNVRDARAFIDRSMLLRTLHGLQEFAAEQS